MSKKRKIIYIFIGLFILLFATINIIYASEIDNKYNNLELYQGYLVEESNIFKKASLLNMIANFFFGMSKIIASIVDFFLKALYQSDGIDSLVDLIVATSTTMYNNVFGKYGMLLFFIALLVALIRFVINSHKGVRDIFQLILLMAVCMMWITNAGTIIKTSNEISNDIQSTIATSSDKLFNGQDKMDGKDALREKYFEQAVEQPFLLMNFNELDKEKVDNNSNIKPKEGKRVENLLKFRTEDDMKKYLKENELNDSDYDNKDKNKDKQNYYVSTYSGTHKLMVATLSIIMNILLSIPYSVLALFNFIIQIQIIFYIIIFPFTFLASYLPFIRTSYIKVFKEFFGLYMIKAMLGVVILFISLIRNLTTKVMEGVEASPTTIYTTSIILLVVALMFMWKNRHKLVDVLTNGKMNYISDYISNRSKPSEEDTKLSDEDDKKINNQNNFQDNNNSDNNTENTDNQSRTKQDDNVDNLERTDQSNYQKRSSQKSLNDNVKNDLNNNRDMNNNLSNVEMSKNDNKLDSNRNIEIERPRVDDVEVSRGLEDNQEERIDVSYTEVRDVNTDYKFNDNRSERVEKREQQYKVERTDVNDNYEDLNREDLQRVQDKNDKE